MQRLLVHTKPVSHAVLLPQRSPRLPNEVPLLERLSSSKEVTDAAVVNRESAKKEMAITEKRTDIVKCRRRGD